VTPFADAGLPWPAEPYPGLRPFLEREAALLFGRQRQIAEVIDRLRQTQFVAVLGGSGSGKSSLIHAGVTPELRSHGIHAAGDLWLPTVCTPGTNVSTEDRLAGRHTPVVRLARRFAELLKGRGSAEADAERVESIAAVFRQDGGFARLLDVFGHELALEPSLRPEDARVLFVLDQFEEVFHPTNADVPDARVLVERTLDHFFAPHPRCFVVLTMRSEHLNDCAGYLELPDAINKSSYLVRRLDEDELREAIVGPTEHFLRLMQLKRQRDEDTGVDVQALPPLPPQVVFEPVVIERLLKDVGDITHDPDHLPLLQHLLARLWQVAQAREAARLEQAISSEVVPAQITVEDLHCAVTAERVPERRLTDDNTLRAAVDAWPSAAMRKFSAAERQAVDEVLRRLAFKDPKTGMYSQQRLRVYSEAPRILGVGKTADDLYTLLHDRFLTSVNYLYWDRRDPDNVTLKVSHEALIRGWAHFQRLVDTEFQHYEGFVAALRRCADWLDSGRNAQALMRPVELARLQKGGLHQRLRQPELRAMWLRQLRRERDADRLTSVAPALEDFLQGAERHAARQRYSLYALLSLALVVGVLLPWSAIALFTYTVHEPITERVEQALTAGRQANSAPLSQVQPAVHGDESTLRLLLKAAQDVDGARDRLPSAFRWLPDVSRQERFLLGVVNQVEPAVNGQLRQLLSTAVWASEAPAAELQFPAALVLHTAACLHQRDSRMDDGELIVQQFTSDSLPEEQRAAAAGSRAWTSRPRRALFWHKPAAGTAEMALYAASADADGSNCSYGPALVRIPLLIGPSAVVDSELKLLVYGVAGDVDRDTSSAVTVLGIDWERDSKGRNRLKQGSTRSVIVDDGGAGSGVAGPATAQAPASAAHGGSGPAQPGLSPEARAAVARARRGSIVAQVARAAGGAGRLGTVSSWRVAGGRVLQLGDQVHWRVTLPTADRLWLDDSHVGELVPPSFRTHHDLLKAGLQTLPKAGQGSACDKLRNDVPWLADSAVEPGVTVDLHGTAGHCFVITRRADAAAAAAVPYTGDATGTATSDGAQARDRWQDASVAVFAKPTGGKLLAREIEAITPLASLSNFGRVREDWNDWYVGESGPCKGWLLLKARSRSGRSTYLAAPWSSSALAELGRDVLSTQPTPGPAAGGCVMPQLLR
jgi:hypothetical protein